MRFKHLVVESYSPQFAVFLAVFRRFVCGTLFKIVFDLLGLSWRLAVTPGVLTPQCSDVVWHVQLKYRWLQDIMTKTVSEHKTCSGRLGHGRPRSTKGKTWREIDQPVRGVGGRMKVIKRSKDVGKEGTG